MTQKAEGLSLAALCAELLIEGVERRGLRTSDRILVDDVPEEVAAALFDGLAERCDRSLEIAITGDDGRVEQVDLQAIAREHFDLIPYRVVDAPAGGGLNAGPGEFAFCLRDFFAVGDGRPRVLLVITPQGNETQKSAQDARADRRLLSRSRLLERYLDLWEVPDGSPMRAVARAYERYAPGSGSWPDHVERFADYAGAARGQPPAIQGRELNRLGCFLPDPTADFVDGERIDDVLDGDTDRRLRRGSTRLDDNAVLHGYLQGVFDSPLEDPEAVLDEMFPEAPQRAGKIAPGLRDVRLDTFKGAALVHKKGPNAFELDAIDVRDAAAWQLVDTGVGLPTLLVSASGETQVHVMLSRPLDRRRERALRLSWSEVGGPLVRTELDGAEGKELLEWPIPAAEAGAMHVHRLALTRGPRAVTRPHDAFHLVVYGTTEATVWREHGGALHAEQQAWQVEPGAEPQLIAVVSGEETAASVDKLETREDEEAGVETSLWRPHGSEVRLRTVTIRPEDSEDGETVDEDASSAPVPLLELLPYVRRAGKRVREGFQAAPDYQAAVARVRWADGAWQVGIKQKNVRLTRRVSGFSALSAERRGYERTAARALLRPNECRWTLQADELIADHWSDAGGSKVALAPMREARAEALRALATAADRRLGPGWRQRADGAVPIPLLSLLDEQTAAAIEAYVDAWCAVASVLLDEKGQFGGASSDLLQQDTLRVRSADGQLQRLIVLPTHPWLLGCLLEFQRRMARTFSGKKRRRLPLAEDEVRKLVPGAVLEAWFVYEEGHARPLAYADGAAFHLEYVPRDQVAESTEPLDYVGRIIARRIGRYLQMHPHLRSDRRTVRVGFSDPGSGQIILEGLRGWIESLQRERGDRLRHIESQTLPAIEVLMFYPPKEDESSVGKAFDRYFRENVGGAEASSVEQALLSRLSYRKIPSLQPRDRRDFCHLCFVRGLVEVADSGDKSADLDEWWDGAFAGGAMATYLRRTGRGGVGARLRSRRGLWIHESEDRQRRALARLHALQAACRFGSLDGRKGIYWDCPLPDLEAMAPTYEHSDWVIHLDRALSLDIFADASSDIAPTIIEYTDQEVPDTPGFDTITVTRRAAPYKEQLGEILTLAELDMRDCQDEGRRSAHALLDDLNVLSGRWALDFLHGSMAESERGNRLKGNVGAALCYRWLKRVEQPEGGMLETNVGPAVPVFISLEEHLRATAAGGLPTGKGWKELHKWLTEDDDLDPPEGYCDDLLVLYVTPTESGEPSRLYGRVIEVKFGRSAVSGRAKAVAQVESTNRVLRDLLSSEALAVREPFRNRQLSLLLKAQLEQAVAVGALDERVYDDLNVRALSANLATGSYTVEYTLGAEIDGKPQHIKGDAFLLHTAQGGGDTVRVDEQSGVRVITLPRRLVEWLAFEESDSPTLTAAPPNTMPSLGHLGMQSPAGQVSADPGVAAPRPAMVRQDTAGEGASEAPEAGEAAGSCEAPWTGPSLAEASALPVKEAPYSDAAVAGAIQRLERGLDGHKVKLAQQPSLHEADRGPRLVRAYVRLAAGGTLQSVRRISEDLAREVGTRSGDIHIDNVPERHAIALDLPVADLEYSVTFAELESHPSFEAAAHELRLGFCAGIDVTGRALWVDLARMPHMLVAGTTGSGKTVFLRSVILTLLLHAEPGHLLLRLSSSKPMDFMPFTQLPAAQGRELARDPAQALGLANELVAEMDRRIDTIARAWCDDIGDYNSEHPADRFPYVVAVFDEFSEMAASFDEKSDRTAFESAIGRLAQKARAAGIHLIVCMQRPDASALKGAIKANILHRFALKLPAQHDSRVILDDNGAETLLGQGDMLYKDADGRLHRLQVPYLESEGLKRCLRRMLEAPQSQSEPFEDDR